MKKRILFLLFLVMPALILSGCAPVVGDKDIPENFSIYASFLPAYMLSDLIVTEDIPGMNLNLLIQPQDGCMRNYVLSDWDQYIAVNSDAVILIGNGFESFEQGLMNLGEEGPSVISASSSLILDASCQTDNEESHLYGANPWLFLSASGGLQLTEAIAANMIALDPDYESVYIGNLKSAYEKFESLSESILEVKSAVDHQKRTALLHEGLIYIANDFALNVVTRIDRESGEYPDETSLSQMLKTLKESNAEVVLIEKQAPKSLLEALRAAGYEIALIDTLSAGGAQNGAEAYFERMLENARAIENAFKK